ncbi:MAG: hypothetical protein CL553_11850 [Alcanivorax sp.]|jgi:hypothetical protein|nr:hypothetical protein [Alcanivorax sp.]|tara:strand:- start:1395 stop:1784 length:390 start_codon:yes stop_codon:yes gene_type:complete
MKKIGIFMMLSFWASMAAANSTEDDATQSLEMWEPKEVRVDGDSLIIISKERRITDQIYRAMIVSGLCMGTISRPSSLDGISEIQVLNQFGRQGYVFEGGKGECEKINNMPANKTEMYVLGQTHMHTNQ